MRLTLLLVLLTTTACGGDDDANVFDSQDAAGGFAATGGSGGGGAGNTGGTAGTGNAGGVAAVGGAPPGGAGGTVDAGGVNVLGAPCEADADCGPRLTCITSSSNDLGGGGPAHGLCSADCSDSREACNAIDPTAFCVTTDDKGTPADQTDDTAYCFPGCPMGNTVDSSLKCLGRPDLACAASAAPPVGFCLPACRNDEDCGDRVCDLQSGLCADQRTGTRPIGADCTSSSECAGLCLTVSPEYSVCSGVCKIAPGGCGEASNATPPLETACLLPQISTLSYVGDAGYCVELCNCNDDCEHPGAVCEDLGLGSVTGRAGICYPADRGGDAGPAPGIACGSLDGGVSIDASPGADAAPPPDGSASDAASTPDAPSDAAGG